MTKNATYKPLLHDTLFKFTLVFSAAVVLVLLAGIFLTLTIESVLSIKEFKLSFLVNAVWNPVTGEFGALSFVIGTLVTSFLALFIAAPPSLAISIFLGEVFKKGKLSLFIKNSIELLAGIPSIVYGFWGMFYLVPIVRNLEIFLEVPPYGVGIFTASIILSLMIIPFSASLGREVISMVPGDLKEAAYSLGATRYDVIKKVIVPYARSGIFAGFMLALGRALGETMAVTMLIGNSNSIPDSIFSPSNSMASVIANEFAEATGELYLSALFEVGLVLLLVTTIINLIGRVIIRRFETG